MSKIMKPALLRATIGFLAFIILLTGTPAQAATIKVKSTMDDNSGNCSLREAAAAINMGKDASGCIGTLNPYGTSDTINLPGSTISLSIGPIFIGSSVTIQGAGYLQTIIDGSNLSILDTPIDIANDRQTSTASILDLTIQNSPATGVTVEPNGSLFMSFVRIINTGNDQLSTGGCISITDGSVVLTSSELKGCKSSGNGGGIQVVGNSSSLSVFNTTIHECVSIGLGGGISIEQGGSATISDSTLANNTAKSGAGLFKGEGVAATLQGVTIAFNENTQGPGEASPAPALFSSRQADTNNSDALMIQYSIVANNTAPNVGLQWQHEANCGIDVGGGSFQIVSGGYNILGNPGDDDCTQKTPPPGIPPTKCLKMPMNGDTDFCADPNFVTTGTLHAPGGAGGVGPVYVPNPGSPALSRVPSTDLFCSTLDERSLSRSKDGNSNCDIGAVSRSSALFVANLANLSHGDQVVENTLTTLGFDKTPVDGNVVTSNSAVGKAIVVVSKSVVLTKFAPATFKNVHAGVLAMNQLIYNAMGMTGPNIPNNPPNFGSVNGTSVDMASIGTFGDLIGNRGTVQVTNTAHTFGWGVFLNPLGISQPEANIQGSPTQSAIFNVPGPATPPDFTLGSRVGFFATQAASADFTTFGHRLLEESIIMATQRNFGD
jgi:hypothetical protein